MNQTEIAKERKGWTSHVYEIVIAEDGNSLWFDDTDSSTDYFHHASLPLRDAIRWINEERDGDTRGSNKIKVTFCNNEDLPKFHKRVAQIAKQCGYRAVNLSHDAYNKIEWEKEARIWKVMEYVLIKKETPKTPTSTFPKCVRCGEPNMTEQAFGECVVCYDCAEKCSLKSFNEGLERIKELQN